MQSITLTRKYDFFSFSFSLLRTVNENFFSANKNKLFCFVRAHLMRKFLSPLEHFKNDPVCLGNERFSISDFSSFFQFQAPIKCTQGAEFYFRKVARSSTCSRSMCLIQHEVNENKMEITGQMQLTEYINRFTSIDSGKTRKTRQIYGATRMCTKKETEELIFSQ